MGKIVFGHNQQAAGIFIDTMYDSRTQHAADSGQRIPAVCQQRVDQRAGIIAGRRMDHHALRLIHHQQIAVLVDNIQRNRLRLCGIGYRLRYLHAHRFPAVQPVVFRPHPAIHRNRALLDPALYRRAALLQPAAQKAVKPVVRHLRRNHRLFGPHPASHPPAPGKYRCPPPARPPLLPAEPYPPYRQTGTPPAAGPHR